MRHGTAVELGNDKLGPKQPAGLESLRKPRAIVPLAALDLDKLLDDLPVAAVQEVINRLALCLLGWRRKRKARAAVA